MSARDRLPGDISERRPGWRRPPLAVSAVETGGQWAAGMPDEGGNRGAQQALAALTGEPHPLAGGDPRTVMPASKMGKPRQLLGAAMEEP